MPKGLLLNGKRQQSVFFVCIYSFGPAVNGRRISGRSQGWGPGLSLLMAWGPGETHQVGQQQSGAGFQVRRWADSTTRVWNEEAEGRKAYGHAWSVQGGGPAWGARWCQGSLSEDGTESLDSCWRQPAQNSAGAALVTSGRKPEGKGQVLVGEGERKSVYDSVWL